MLNEENKVIQFPGHSKKNQQEFVSDRDTSPAPILEKYKSHRFQFDSEQRKILVSACLVTILFGVTIANRVLLDDKPFSTNPSSFQSRSVASIGSTLGAARNTEWERGLVSQLLQPGTRSPASIGQAPTAEERLQFGLLEGKYAVEMKQGKIEHLRFVADFDRPTYLDPLVFLFQQRELLPAEFEDVRLVQRREEDHIVKEIYSLDSGSSSVGTVAVEMDFQGRLLTLTVVEPPAVH